MTTYPSGQATSDIQLPGFRFHPTEDELLNFYLKNTILGKNMPFDVITSLNIYHFDPWELPGKARLGEREWYFFVPRDRKHGSGGRPNRTTERGFWKATGSDRKIVGLSEPKGVIGLRKTLVFYKGRAPRGRKTDWVMNEYRLPDNCKLSKEIVLCKVYRKATSLKVLEQRVAMEENLKAFQSPSPMDTCLSFCGIHEEMAVPPPKTEVEGNKETTSGFDFEVKGLSSSSCCVEVPLGYRERLPDIEVPVKTAMDWNNIQDLQCMQFNSPWLQTLQTLFTPHNILNMI